MINEFTFFDKEQLTNVKRFERKWLEYCSSKGKPDVPKAFPLIYGSPAFTPSYINTFRAAQELSKSYDFGIGIAWGGVFSSFAFYSFGLPVSLVNMSRTGKGASWSPIDGIDYQKIHNKRVIVIENDAITGRTLRRAIREIGKFKPHSVDLLLHYENIPLSFRRYMGFVIKGYPMPSLKEIVEHSWNKEHSIGKVTSIQEKENYCKIGYSLSNSNSPIYYIAMDFLWLNTRRVIPDGFDNVMTLQKDFSFSDKFEHSRSDIAELERKLAFYEQIKTVAR